MQAERTQWPALLAAAQRMGVPPGQFWRLSLKEWRALAAPASTSIMTRTTFESLAQRYPDTQA